MKKFVIIAIIAVQALLVSGCAAAWQNVGYSDDMYSIHNQIAIAERQKAEAELAKAQYEAQQAQYEAAMAKANAEAAKQQAEGAATGAAYNVYDSVLADTYESAYARRLYGFSSPTYRMPSSYYTWRYSDAFGYASAYDPAFYNVMVSGDMVWVEPKYITSMFGTWGAAVVPSYGWYYGWGNPYRYWSSPYYSWYNYNWYYGWNSCYYWGCSHPYYHYYHHHHHYPHRPSYHRPPHHNRPPYAGSGSVGNTGHHHNRPGATVGRNPGATRPVDRVEGVRPTTPNRGGTKPVGGTTITTPSGGKAGSTPYRGGSKPISGTTVTKPSSGKVSTTPYRGSSKSSSSSSSSSSSRVGSSSYRSSSSSSSFSGGGSVGGSRSISVGGNSRGR
ncbi:MAG: hypothetical protein IKL20_04440 [Alistipes sp.]|nr:hypothetical protein [Alistipes sp.]